MIRAFALTLALLVAAAAGAARAAAPIGGTWSLEPSATPGAVHFSIRTSDAHGGSNVSSSFSITPAELGLSDSQIHSSGAHVTFTLVREAGSIACQGSIANGNGGGPFTFTPSPAYAAAMASLGVGSLTPQDQLVGAVLDISTAYVRSLAAAGYPHLSFANLTTFRALKIDDAYVRAMRAAFATHDLPPSQLTPLKALDVTPEYLAGMENAGCPIATSSEAIRLKALHIDAAYVKRVEAHGFAHPTVDQLVRLKALNVI